jgi:hypothetical protein
MRLQIANRLPLEMLADGKCDTWSGTLSAVHRLKTERNNALAEVDDLSAKEADYCNHIVEVDKKVYQLEAQNERLREALWQALQGWEYDGISDEHGSVYLECDKRVKESPAQSLADIHAQAVESLLSDLRRDTADTNPARHIFQRMQLRIDTLRASAHQSITNQAENSSELVDVASNRQFDCWSCRITVAHSDVDEADGHCPHCDVEIEREDRNNEVAR